jgi:hypothetical protein
MRVRQLALVLGLSTLGAACGGAAGEAGVTVSARVATGAATAAGPGRAITLPAADQVLAFPIQNGLILPGGMAEMITAPIAADGGFSIKLPQSSDWMLVLVASTAPASQRFVGYVGATVDAGNSLLALPVSAAGAAGTLALGTVAPAAPGGDTYASAAAVQDVDFTLSRASLSALARADDALKSLKNLILNTQGPTFSAVIPEFGFEPAGGALLAAGAWGAPGAYQLESSWGLHVETNHPAIRLDLLCGATPSVVSLTSPAAATYSSEGSTCSGAAPARQASNGAGFYAIEKSDAGAFGSRAAVNFSPYTGAIPAGDWLLSVGGVSAARFDVAVAAPADALGRPALVPVVRATTDASHRITRLDLRWYVPDGGSGFTEIVDPAVFTHLLRTVVVSLQETTAGGEGPGRIENFTVDPVTTSSVVPTGDWYVGGGEPALHADRLQVMMGNGGVGRAFLTLFE